MSEYEELCILLSELRLPLFATASNLSEYEELRNAQDEESSGILDIDELLLRVSELQETYSPEVEIDLMFPNGMTDDDNYDF